MAIDVKTKKWGNSLGIVIPSETANKLEIHPNETITVEISKKDNALKELFGSVPSKKSTRQILAEVREDFEGKWPQ